MLSQGLYAIAFARDRVLYFPLPEGNGVINRQEWRTEYLVENGRILLLFDVLSRATWSSSFRMGLGLGNLCGYAVILGGRNDDQSPSHGSCSWSDMTES
jgi:hypothetical protein